MAIFKRSVSTADSDSVIKTKIFDRRVFVVSIVQVFTLSVVYLRLLYLQVFQHKKYVRMAQQNQYHPDFILPIRGDIVDSKGSYLAYNRTYYKAVLSKTSVQKINYIASIFATLLDKSTTASALSKTWIAEMRKNPQQELVLWRFLSRDEIARISFNAHLMSGVSIEEDTQRLYPLGHMAAHVVGYLRNISKENLHDTPAFFWKKLASKEYKLGQTGVEKSFNSVLAGKLGVYIKRVDSFGNNLNGTVHQESSPGSSVRLTINNTLQTKAANLLSNKEGSLVLLDIKTGDILAMYSSPSFDPNNTSRKIDSNTWNNLNTTKNVFINKSTSTAYSPGSVFKLVSAIQALRYGVNPMVKYRCTGTFRLGNRIFHCHKVTGHGLVDMKEAIIRSCNCYFYSFAKQFDINELASVSYDLGFGHSYDKLSLYNRSGIVPTRNWKRKNFKQHWTHGDTCNTMIGQGYIEVTPLQIAIMTARIGSGINLRPNLILDHSRVSDNVLSINSEHLDVIRIAMRRVFADKHGTCHWFDSSNPRYQFAGKTGTAQVVSRRLDKYDLMAGRIPYELRPHGLFAGYGPFNNPRFAISIVVEHGISGIRAAALARNLLVEAVDLLEE